MNKPYCTILLSFSHRPGSLGQPIWSTYMRNSSSDSCFGTSNSCPTSRVTNCTHSEDVTVACSKFKMITYASI